VVKKIADEHGARIRIANLGTTAADASAGSARGAQVSLSFSKLAAAVPAVADEAVAARAR
jgi:nitrogen fixation/metabolism regulation signal transduction histidine kinase